MTASFLDGLDEELALAETSPKSDEHLAEVIEEARPEREKRIAEVESIQSRMFDRHLRIVEDVARFHEIEITDTEPPEEWIAEMGLEEAKRTFRIAKAAWFDAKSAPIALKVSAQVVTAMMKAKAMEKGGRELNIGTLVLLTPPVLAGEEPLRMFPRKEVDE